MKKLIILNHKMNLEYDEVYSYIDKLNAIETNNSVIVCPSNIYLESFMNHCSWGVGAQDVYYKRSGNYTGAISTLQLKSLGIEYSMLGHYERKKYFRESNKIINKKLNACLDSNIEPILCFGESGNKEEIIQNLEELLTNVSNVNFIIFAYEPLELEEVPKISEIEENINAIYDYLYQKYKTIPNIVYGGGITEENINEMLKIDKLNGILIGGISADINKITKVINNIDE